MGAFIITLREGVEIALVLGILFITLRNLKRYWLYRWVWAGTAAAFFASILTGALLFRFYPINEEAWEGVLYIVGALFLASMMVWMHRQGKELEKNIQNRVSQLEGKKSWREGIILAGLTFLLLFREGVELVLFLGMMQLSTESLFSFFGIGLAVVLSFLFGLFFTRGILPVNLRTFFWITEWILALFLVQLLINGYHELAEAGWLPATRSTMAFIGPVVRHNTLFLIVMAAIPLLLWWKSPSVPDHLKVEDWESLSRPERRLYKARLRQYKVYRYGALVLMFFFLGFAGALYAQELRSGERPLAKAATIQGELAKIPLQELEDGRLHHYGVVVGGALVRFLAIRTSDGRVRTTFDACEICGPMGYVQEQGALVCLNCTGEINPLSLGLRGGCNPIPLSSRIDGEWVVISLWDLAKEAPRFREISLFQERCPVCDMLFAVKDASSFVTYKGKNYYFCAMKGCREKFLAQPERFAK